MLLWGRNGGRGAGQEPTLTLGSVCPLGLCLLTPHPPPNPASRLGIFKGHPPFQI